MKENSATQELIMDDEEDVTQSQSTTYQIEHSNDIATGVLSTNDCDTKKSINLMNSMIIPMTTSKLTEKLKNT